MEAGNFTQSADLPKPQQPVRFNRRDFPAPWTCIPFLLPMSFEVFNPEKHQIRMEPGFIVSTAKNEIVAYSRICTHCRHRQPINFMPNTLGVSYLPQSNTPVLVCPCDCCLSTFDLSDGCRVLQGPACRPPLRMNVAFDGDNIIITGLEQGAIA